MDFNSTEEELEKGRVLQELLGNYRTALSNLEKAPGQILFDISRLLFYYGHYEEALETMVKCHRSGLYIPEVEDIIFQAYYLPNIYFFEEIYNKNIEKLKEYGFIYQKKLPDFVDLRYIFIPYSDKRYAIFDRACGVFSGDVETTEDAGVYEEINENDVLILNGFFKTPSLLKFEEITKNKNPLVWYQRPLYLYHECLEEFASYLQLFDFSGILDKDRLVFLFGPDELTEWFQDTQTMLPVRVVNMPGSKEEILLRTLRNVYVQRERIKEEYENKIMNFYGHKTKEQILENIQSGKPKILFITSRFTTALQYYIRDCAIACEKLEIPCRVLIEKHDTFRVLYEEWMRVMDEFRPDIVLGIDHYKWEYPALNENVLYVTWEQDMLPHLITRENAAKTTDMEIIFNQQYDISKKLVDLGYPEEQIFDGPVPANPDIYKKYELTEDERTRYHADICYFSNTGDSRKGLESVFEFYGESPRYESCKCGFQAAYDEIYELAYNGSDIVYKKDIISGIIEKHLYEQGICFTTEENKSEAAERFTRDVVYRLIREIPLIWLHERGYDMKLYGAEWSGHPVLGIYDMGVAGNGEELAKIINASKIVLGLNPIVTCHARAAEAILSGSFYLCWNVPRMYDNADIRKYLTEGEEIIIAYDRQDLYDKIDYYLANEDKRIEINRRGREKILNSLTYEMFIRKVLRESKQWMQRLIDEEKRINNKGEITL